MNKPILLLSSLAPLVLGFAAIALPAGSDFSRFVDQYFDARYAFRPTEGTAQGFHQYDTKPPDLSRRAVEARIGELKRELARLSSFDRGKLSFDDGIDAELLEAQIRGELLTLETLRSWENNPMQYAGLPGGAVNGLMKRDFAPAAQRLRSAIARMKGIPGVYAAARENIKNPPKEFTDLAIRMSRGSVGFFERSVAAWGKEAAGGDADLARQFEEANTAVITAGREFATWLEKDLKTRSNGRYAIGEANFLAKLKYDDMVEMPLAQLLAKGEAQLAKDYTAFVQTAKTIDPRKTPAEVMKSLSDPHPRRGAIRRGRAPVRRRQGARDDSFRGSSEGRGDASLCPLRKLRVDGHAGSLRDQGDGGLLLRHAGREGLGLEAPGGTPAPLQPLRRRDDRRARGLARPLPAVSLRAPVPD